MPIPLIDLRAQYASLKTEIDAAVRGVMSKQNGVLGEEVERLEHDVAKFCGAAHAIGVASGTDALIVSFLSLGIGPGDGVVTVPFTFFATAGAAVRAGARPFFVDIDPVTYNLSPSSLSVFFEKECERRDGFTVHKSTGVRIKAIVPVHLYGQCADMDRIFVIASRWNVFIVEDACQAIGATFNGRQAGTMGDLGALSFFPTKNLGGLGDGGMILTNNDDLARRVRRLRVHGSERRYFHQEVGMNSRLDTLQAAILNAKLSSLVGWNERRRSHAAFYNDSFARSSSISTPGTDARNVHVYHQYTLRVRNRDDVRARLSEKGVASEVYYPLCLHLQECFAGLGHRPGDYPESERASQEVLSIPVYPEMTDEARNAVSEAVLSILR